jgi:hypothetical protein
MARIRGCTADECSALSYETNLRKRRVVLEEREESQAVKTEVARKALFLQPQ